MSNNREISQLASVLKVKENSNFIGIATEGLQIIGIGTDSISLNGTNGRISATSFNGNVTGNITGTADSFAVTANNTADETVFPVFVDGATGSQGAETDTGLNYNPSSGTLSATKFAGDGSLLTNIPGTGGSGVASTITVGDESSDTTCFPIFSTESVGDINPKTGSNLSFNSSNGTLSATTFDGNLATTNLTGTITNAQLAGSIANSKLANSTVSFGGVSAALGQSDATPAFDLSDATNYPTSSLSGTITNAQLAGSIADSKLNTISTAGKVDLAALEIDGGTDIGAALADADLFIVDDDAGGTNRKTAASRIKTYIADVTLTTAAQTNITSVGTLSSLVASTAKVSDLTDNRIVIAGASGELEDSSKLTFDGSTLAIVGDATFTGNVSIAGTLTKEDVTDVDSIGLVTARTGVRINSGGLVISSGIATFTDNIIANGNIVGDNSTNITGIAGVTATTLSGTLQTAAQTNITSVGTLSALTVSGDITANGNIAGDNATNITGIAGVTATTLSGTLQTAAQPNITSVGTLSSLNVSGVLTATSYDIELNDLGDATTSSTSLLLGTGVSSNSTENTVVGQNAGAAINSRKNTYVGNEAGRYIADEENTGIGNQALGGATGSNQTGTLRRNTAVGDRSLSKLANGAVDNTAVGTWSGEYLTTGESNTLIGRSAGSALTTGGSNTFVGFSCGDDTTSSNNTGLGARALDDNITGTSNVAIGYHALYISTVSKNTALGYQAGDVITTGQNNICIGHNADASSATVSNEITLGDSDITTFRIPGIGVTFGESGANISGIVTATEFSGGGAGITGLTASQVGAIADVVSDTTPQLGGNLDINSKFITGTGGISITGIITATDFNSASDQNLKENIRTIEDPLAKVVQIRGVNFDWKENQKPSVGVIAQEVEKVFPELVANGEKKTVNYNGLIGLLIEVVKEQQTQINSLNERLSKLE